MKHVAKCAAGVAFTIGIGLFAPIYGAEPGAQLNQEAASVHGTPEATVSRDRAPKELPKSESQLRQLLTDTNRRIDELERETKSWSNVIGALNEKLQTMPAPRNDIAKLLADAETAANNKDVNRTLNALRNLNSTFFAPATIANYQPIGYGDQQNLAEAGSPPKLFLSKSENQISNAAQKFYDKANQWLTNSGVVLYSYGQGTSEKPSGIPSREQLKELESIFSDAAQKAMFDELSGILNDAIRTGVGERNRVEQELDSKYTLRDQINEAIDKGKKEINELAIELGLPLFCGTVLLLFAIPFGFLRFGSRGDGPVGIADLRRFQFGTLVEISTVLLLTMSILILGLAQKLDGPVLGTLLGGISGYVLNRARGARATTNEGR